MNTNQQSPRDESDDALDRMICIVTAQPSPLDAKNRVIEKAAAFAPDSRPRPRSRSRRSWRIVVSAVATVSAACAIAFLFLPSLSVGWADVIKAVKSQPWIRATRNWNDKHDVMWISPKRQVWAFHTENWFIFFDGCRQEKFEYRTGEKQIEKMPLSESDAQRILPVDYSLSGSWAFGTETLVSQKRHEVVDAGKKWIDFEIACGRGEYNRGTLRVSPETRLPVYMVFTSSKDATKSFKFTFAYPADGPADIYALGVPAKITIDDRMPPEDCLRVLNAMAASRARIGDFRLVVALDPPNHGVSSLVWRKGRRWRIDMCDSENVLPRKLWGTKPPDGLGWGNSFAEQLKLCWVRPNFICDGRMVYKNAQRRLAAWFNDPKAQGVPPVKWEVAPLFITPQTLLSGEGLGQLDLAPYAKIASLVYPDLSPRPGWGFEFDQRPADMPGCVLIRRSARIVMKEPTVGHEWYYIDPAKGCAVVRVELFNLPANAAADLKTAGYRTSFLMEDFEQSPQGFWYPKTIRYTNRQPHGPNATAGSGVHSLMSTVHYQFDFNAALPDSLFAVEGASEPKK